MNWTHAPNQIHMTEDERWLDRIEHMNPPDDEPFKRLACGVILAVAKTWTPNKGNRNLTAREFFTSEDYLLWAFLAGVNVEGKDILKALEENGGLNKRMMRDLYVKPFEEDE